MRRRLIMSTFVVVLVVVALLGVPLAVIDARLIEQNAQGNLVAEANRVLALVETRPGVGKTRVPDALSGQDLRDLGPQIAKNHYAIIQVGTTQRVRLHGTPSVPQGKLISERARDGYIQVTVMMARGPVARQIRDALLLILGVAGLALLAAVGMSFLLSRRLSRPLGDLADTAERLGSGDPRPRHRRYGIPELDRVAEVIDQSAERISQMLGAERRLAADASHQLRTPLTALSMRLEEIIDTSDPTIVKEEATIALTQVERLTSVVQTLLTNARESRSASVVPVEVDAVLQQQHHEWRPAFQSAGRVMRIRGERGLIALATPGALAQVLSTLLENSLMHGAGRVTLTTRSSGTSVVLEVSDEGPGVPSELGNRVFERAVSGRASTGLGLAMARELAEADGGRLELSQQRPPVFSVFLTAAEGEEAPTTAGEPAS